MVLITSTTGMWRIWYHAVGDEQQKKWLALPFYWLTPFRTTAPFGGQTRQTLCDLSHKQDCGPKRVKVVVLALSAKMYVFRQATGLALLGPQSRSGDKLLRIWLVCPQNGIAVQKGLNESVVSVQQRNNFVFLFDSRRTSFTHSMCHLCKMVHVVCSRS